MPIPSALNVDFQILRTSQNQGRRVEVLKSTHFCAIISRSWLLMDHGRFGYDFVYQKMVFFSKSITNVLKTTAFVSDQTSQHLLHSQVTTSWHPYFRLRTGVFSIKESAEVFQGNKGKGLSQVHQWLLHLSNRTFLANVQHLLKEAYNDLLRKLSSRKHLNLFWKQLEM